MKRGNNPLVLCLFGILPVVWLGLLIAPAAHGGLPEILLRQNNVRYVYRRTKAGRRIVLSRGDGVDSGDG